MIRQQSASPWRSMKSACVTLLLKLINHPNLEDIVIYYRTVFLAFLITVLINS